jgi:hypothetical protein
LEKIEKQISDALAKGDANKAEALKKQQEQAKSLLEAAKSSQNDLS